MTARRTLLSAAALALVLAACGSGESGSSQSSQRGTALLAAATAFGNASDAVSFRLQGSGAGNTDETFARRGEDSLVAAEFGEGGRNEIRRVGGVTYARADLKLPAGQVAPWVRIDAGPDQATWLTLLGDGVVAPTPQQATGLLTGQVARVTALEVGDAGARTLTVDPKPVRNGERPSSIAVRRSEAAIVGRSAELFSNGKAFARRTYLGVRWGARAVPITVPEGAVSVEAVRDPQSAALPAAILRGPAALPAGWSLRSVIGITPTQGDGTCQQVLTLYAPTGRPLSAGYLGVYLKPSGCETPKVRGAADFTAGTYAGWIGQDAGASVGGLTVDGVSVRFRSSLTETELATVLASWGPLG
jgi:hypothetical protein